MQCNQHDFFNQLGVVLHIKSYLIATTGKEGNRRLTKTTATTTDLTIAQHIIEVNQQSPVTITITLTIMIIVSMKIMQIALGHGTQME
jgi:hypothetical protein